MMNPNNVIQFPKQYEGPRINGLSAQDIQENVNMMKHFHIQETIANLAPMIFNNLEISGFELVDEEETFAVKDGALIVEAIRSILCKHYGIFHPFQPLSEAVFEFDPEEEGALKIVDTLNIEMTETEISKGDI
jgi:hypothetical protein